MKESNMLEKIIIYSVKNKLIIGLFVSALVLWGGYEVTRLPIDAVPDITDNQVQVITVSPSLGAPDIERLITFPVEQSCNNIPGLKQIRSFSRFGLSLVTVVFEDDVDIYWARQQINERLQQVNQSIPEGVGTPELAPVTTGLGEIYQYVLRPEKGYEQKYDAMELRTLQDWVVRRQLLGTPGVADVSSFGGRLKQYEIAVQTEQLKAFGISIAEIFDALERNNQNTGGAYIEKGPTVLYIRSEGLTTSIKDIEQVVIKPLDNGLPLLVRDVANVQLGSAVRYGAMTYNDQGEVAGAVVMMLKGENSSAVIKRVKARIAEIQASLPKGVIIEPFLDRTKMVNNAIKTVQTNLIEGALIVIFVLVFFLGNLRAGLIVSSVIPLSMLFAIILMNLFGVSGNLMSLGAIDFGIIVDGSVIVVEAILHRLSHSKHFRSFSRIDQATMDTEVRTSTSSMIRSAVFSQIIILIVYFPLLSLQGIEGKMFKPMAFTMAFAVIGAFLLSVTYVPMMSALALSRKLSHKDTLADRLMGTIERIFQPMLARTLAFPRTVITITVLLFAGSVGVLTSLGGEFIPELEEGDFAVETRLLTGSNLNATIESTQKATGILLKNFPEVEKIVTKIGSSEIPVDPMPFEASDMMVILKDKKDWTSASSFDELAEKMTKAVSVVPGITIGFQYPVQMRFNELMTGARQDVVCKIFGDNLDTLSHYATQLSNIIQGVEGAIDIYQETVTGMPQIIIQYNREAMAKYGVNVSDINRIVNTAFAGQSAGLVYEGEKRFDLVVRLSAEKRQNMTDIENLTVPTSAGRQVPLSELASIVESDGVNQIQRENTSRRIIVGFNVTGRDVQSIVEELQGKVKQRIQLPAEYSLTYGGAFENMNAAMERLSVVVPIALMLIFLLLYFAFNSVKQGLLIYTAIPLSAIGGILALWMRDMPLSISAGVGFIALFGVAVLNGILLVSEFNRLEAEGWADITKRVIHATKSKLRAVLMTALVPSLGFIPMAVSTGAGGEVQKPLATVVIGGLLISCMLTLFVLPLLYVLFEKGFKHGRQSIRTSLHLLLALALPMTGISQQQLTMQGAVDSALNKNPVLLAARTETAIQRSLLRSYFDPSKTVLGFEYGNLNSYFTDNKFYINQSIELPSVYNKQKKLYSTNVAISQAELKVREVDMAARVKTLYFDILLMEERRKWLIASDSIYILAAAKAAVRFKAGEVEISEKAAAENQQMQTHAQLRLLETEMVRLRNELSMLTGINDQFVLASDSLRYSMKYVPDTAFAAGSPWISLQDQRILQGQAQLEVNKSNLLPELNVGYNNMSIAGWQKTSATAEKFFDRSNRFSYVGVGIGLPILQSAEKARIKAAALTINQRRQESDAIRNELHTVMKNALATYHQTNSILSAYEKSLLPNAGTILRSAEKRLNAGEIQFLEWMLLANQSLDIRMKYLDILQENNHSAILIDKWNSNQ